VTGSRLVVKDVNSATAPINEIVSQTPIAGAKAKSGSVIDVNVSKGPSVVTLPRSLIGETCNQAAAQLTALHVKSTCPANRRVYSNVIAVNHVYRVLYEHSVNPLVVPKGATVILQRSKGTPASTTTTTAPTTTTTSSDRDDHDHHHESGAGAARRAQRRGRRLRPDGRRL
jgi:hypothetical protein